MQVSDATMRRIVDDLHDGLYFTDTARCITFWNRSAERISGFPASEVVGRRCGDGVLNHIDARGRRLCGRNCPLKETMGDGRPRQAVVHLHHRDGHRVPVEVRVSPMTAADGSIIGGIELFVELSADRAGELWHRESKRLSELDHLTQLPNRRFVDRELANRLDQLRTSGVRFGVLFVDVDHFKSFNDLHGHRTGDDVLRVVARALVANARAFDVYGRWGGDEFLGIVRDIDPAELATIAERLRIAVGASSLRDDSVRQHLSVSIGAAFARVDDSVDDLLERADRLMYDSKRGGRNLVTTG